MNLPNKITLTRICFIPVFILVFFLDMIPCNYLIAGIVYAVAAFTDFIDGHIARSRGLVTNLGKFLDPIADKVLVSTAMILLLTIPFSFNLYGIIPSIADEMYIVVAVCVCIIMARELIISAFRQIAASRGLVLAAEMIGKYKTVFQDIAILALLVAADVPELLGVTCGKIVYIIGLILFAVATILTIWSGITYVLKNKQVLKDS